jgi:hypothetical protein
MATRAAAPSSSSRSKSFSADSARVFFRSCLRSCLPLWFHGAYALLELSTHVIVSSTDTRLALGREMKGGGSGVCTARVAPRHLGPSRHTRSSLLWIFLWPSRLRTFADLQDFVPLISGSGAAAIERHAPDDVEHWVTRYPLVRCIHAPQPKPFRRYVISDIAVTLRVIPRKSEV